MENQKIEIGTVVSFIHEGTDWRIYGVITAIDGDSVFIQTDDRTYEASIELDRIEVVSP